MTKSKDAAAIAPTAVDWTGANTQRVEYGSGATIFAQGDPATSVMYIEQGTVRLSGLSHAGKEAVIAPLRNPVTFSDRAAWLDSHTGWRLLSRSLGARWRLCARSHSRTRDDCARSHSRTRDDERV